eukprot:6410935-Amphidinium_carterae.3
MPSKNSTCGHESNRNSHAMCPKLDLIQCVLVRRPTRYMTISTVNLSNLCSCMQPRSDWCSKQLLAKLLHAE